MRNVSSRDETKNEKAVMAILAKRFNGKCTINGIQMLEAGRSKVYFIKPRSTKVVRAIVRTAGEGSVTFTKEQPEQID